VLKALVTAAVLAIVLLVVLPPFILGYGFSTLQLVLTAGVLVGGGLLLRHQGGMTRTSGSAMVVIGLVSLAIAIAVLAFVVLWCCP
jgi:hypothetical protein